MTPSRKRLASFGAIAALAVVIAGAAYYYFHRPAATTETAATTPAAAPTRTRTRAPATPTTPPDAVTPTSAQSDKVLRLVGDARRLATAGDFTGADAALTQARKHMQRLGNSHAGWDIEHGAGCVKRRVQRREPVAL